MKSELLKTKRATLLCVLFWSHNGPYLKSDFFHPRNTWLTLPVGIFRAAEESNSRKYACRQELMDF